MQLASKVDTIVIMSGDSDYIELVRHLKSEGVRVEIASVDATTANVIKEKVTITIELTKMIGSLTHPNRTIKITKGVRNKKASNEKSAEEKLAETSESQLMMKNNPTQMSQTY